MDVIAYLQSTKVGMLAVQLEQDALPMVAASVRGAGPKPIALVPTRESIGVLLDGTERPSSYGSMPSSSNGTGPAVGTRDGKRPKVSRAIMIPGLGIDLKRRSRLTMDLGDVARDPVAEKERTTGAGPSVGSAGAAAGSKSDHNISRMREASRKLGPPPRAPNNFDMFGRPQRGGVSRAGLTPTSTLDEVILWVQGIGLLSYTKKFTKKKVTGEKLFDMCVTKWARGHCTVGM